MIDGNAGYMWVWRDNRNSSAGIRASMRPRKRSLTRSWRDQPFVGNLPPATTVLKAAYCYSLHHHYSTDDTDFVSRPDDSSVSFHDAADRSHWAFVRAVVHTSQYGTLKHLPSYHC